MVVVIMEIKIHTEFGWAQLAETTPNFFGPFLFLLFRLFKMFLHHSTSIVVSFVALCALHKQLPTYQQSEIFFPCVGSGANTVGVTSCRNDVYIK